MGGPLPSLAETALEAAGIGGWELDVATGRMRWTRLTFAIYGAEPSQEPPLEAALA